MSTASPSTNTAQYPQSPVDNHRRKPNQSPPPSTELPPREDPMTPIHHRRMTMVAGEWMSNGGNGNGTSSPTSSNDWLEGPDADEMDRTSQRPWSSSRDPTPSPTKPRARTRTYLTYLLFSLMIGINIYIIARSFAAESEHRHQLLHLGNRKDRADGRHAAMEDADRKAYDVDGYYASRDSPMFCDLCPSGDEFCKSIGYQNIASSVVYEGSNIRLHRILRKLQNGEAISMAAIGGSVSSGHGLGVQGGKYPTDEREGPLNVHRRIFDYLTSKYPHPKHRFTNGAVSATGSDYFGTCFPEHIPDDVDIVTVELAINDVRNLDVQVEYEILLRGLLNLPNRPAIINIHTMSLMFKPISQGGDLHLGISHFYDIPTISLRSLVLPLIFDDYRAADQFFVMNRRTSDDQSWDDLIDYRHLSVEGHHLLANLTNIYLERQFCKMAAMNTLSAEGDDPTAHSSVWPSKHKYDSVPKMMLTRQYNKDNYVPPLHPQCFSTISKHHPLRPVEQFGWEPWAWKDKKYLVARVPGARVSFAIETKIGWLKVFYQRSGKYGLGQVDCWVDDDVHKKMRIDAYWTYEFSLVAYTVVRNDLTPGPHVLHCEVQTDTNDPGGGHEFRMTSLTAL